MLAAVDAATPGAQRARRLSKTGLTRLRVDGLRELVEQLGGDPRGTKDVLIQRLMDIAGAEERQRLAAEAEATTLQQQQQRQAGGGPAEG